MGIFPMFIVLPSGFVLNVNRVVMIKAGVSRVDDKVFMRVIFETSSPVSQHDVTGERDIACLMTYFNNAKVNYIEPEGDNNER